MGHKVSLQMTKRLAQSFQLGWQLDIVLIRKSNHTPRAQNGRFEEVYGIPQTLFVEMDIRRKWHCARKPIQNANVSSMEPSSVTTNSAGKKVCSTNAYQLLLQKPSPIVRRLMQSKFSNDS
jgi:hypothetical protein